METSIPFACLSPSSRHVGRGQRAAFLRPLLFLLLQGRPNRTPAGGKWTPLSIEGPTEGGRPAGSLGSGRGLQSHSVGHPTRGGCQALRQRNRIPRGPEGRVGLALYPTGPCSGQERMEVRPVTPAGALQCPSGHALQWPSGIRRELCSGCLSDTILSRSWGIQNSPERADQTYFLGRTATQIKALPLVDPLLWETTEKLELWT